MKSVGRALLTVSVAGTCSLAVAHTGFAAGRIDEGSKPPRVFTDGRLRPGHLETIRVAGFPGKGVTEVTFFPTAICEDECGARSFQGGRTDANGAAKFRVHVPGTFIDHRGRYVYFRDGERVNVNVTWEGADDSFSSASAKPEPIIVRNHGSHHG
jgi:hypothetical protein